MALLDRRPDDRAGRLECVEDEAGRHQLPGGRGDPVARDRERCDRPGQVHDRYVAPGMTPVPHEGGPADGSETTCSEYEPQRSRGTVQVVLHYERQQDFRRTQEHEIRDRRREQRPPEPHTTPDEAEPFLQGRNGGELEVGPHSRQPP